MKIYQFDAHGYFTGFREAQKDPQNPGKFLSPPNSTEVATPATLPANSEWQWNKTAWVAVTSRAYAKAQAEATAKAAADAAAKAAASAAPAAPAGASVTPVTPAPAGTVATPAQGK